jgi:hypothetical protein
MMQERQLLNLFTGVSHWLELKFQKKKKIHFAVKATKKIVLLSCVAFLSMFKLIDGSTTFLWIKTD